MPREIDELLSSTGDDKELAARLGDMGIDDAPPDGARAFLLAVRPDILRELPG